jgi:hypothetical protein
MVEKADPESRPPQPAKKAPAELPETDDPPPLRPAPPLRLTYDTPEETDRVWTQYHRDVAAWEQQYPAWLQRYRQRQDKARAERQAKKQEEARANAERLAKDREAEAERQIEATVARSVRAVAEAQAKRRAKDRKAARALAKRQAKDREAELERQAEASAARAVRVVVERLQTTPPVLAKKTPRGRGGRKPYPPHERDIIVNDYQQRLDRNEPKAAENSAAWVVGQVAEGKLSRAVHRDTIRTWHRQARVGETGRNWM